MITKYQEPIPKMTIKKMKIISRLHLSITKSPSLKDFGFMMYNNGFKDGVKANQKEVKKHYDEICEHFGI